MDVVKIRAETSDGQVYVGPIMGNGGMLGSRALQAGLEIGEELALNMLRICQERDANDETIPIFQPLVGHVALYPGYCAATDGPQIDIPLAGTTFTIDRSST